MAIKEKPQLLEFNWNEEESPGIVWNIKYDPNDHIDALHVSGNGQSFSCPVELFGDVTAFLQSKNIIKPNILTRGRTVSTPGIGPVAESLLPPTIEGDNSMHVAQLSKEGPPMDALASFDITHEASTVTQPVVNDEVIEDIEPIDLSEIPETVTVDAGKNVVTSETESEIPKRTVIRTRISGDDPQSAEKEAAALRGAGKAVKKNFKRA